MNLQQTNGYLYALGASLALAASFVFSKSALNHLSMLQFGLLWFSLGVVWNGIWFLVKRDYRNVRGDGWQKTGVALVIAILEGAATGLFYMAIKAMENPAVVSFIGNIGPVFVTLMGILLLKERFRALQLIGIITTIIGVFIINFREGGFAGFTDPGSLYVISAAFLFSLATIVGRRMHLLLVPGYMSLIRSFILAMAMGLMFFKYGESTTLSLNIWKDLALGSFLETLLVIVFAYNALKLIEATKTSLLISTKGVWTLLLAWIFLGVFPTGVQLLGGLLTLAGVWLITWNRKTTPQE
jgi:drug/metabolite transporter (DMT)-like permease